MTRKLIITIPQVIKSAIHTPIYEKMRELKKTNTQKAVADIIGESSSTVNNICNGNITSISLDKLISIAGNLGIEISITTSQEGIDTVTKITK